MSTTVLLHDPVKALTPEAYHAKIVALGRPDYWKCPDCGINFVVFPELPFTHACQGFPTEPQTCYCSWRLIDDHRVESFIVANLGDQNSTVETLNPDGTIQLWERIDKGGLAVWWAPKHYRDGEFCNGERGVCFRYDKRLQRHEFVNRWMLERLAINSRVTFDMARR